MKRLISFLFLGMLAACDAGLWNDPYPAGDAGQSIFYSVFTERPKHLDPVQAYSENEYIFLANIYQPPLQYHYLKRPYTLIPDGANEMPVVRYLDKNNRLLPTNAPPERIAYSVYEIHLHSGLNYQPHPALAVDAAGKPRYWPLAENALHNINSLTDFKETGTRAVTAADYVYQIKRLAHPDLHSPIFGVMAEYIVGLKEYAETLQQARKAQPEGWLDLNAFPLPGVEMVDAQTYRIKVRGNYPQFAYWLAMPFFAPMPWEAERFYAQAGMREHNLTLDWWPIGSGPYYLIENDPNRRMVLARNPNFSGERYPSEGEPDDRAAGLLNDAGKPLPLIDKVVFTLEKETIPYWNKFLQGYYDVSGIASDSFDQAIQVSVNGETNVSDAMKAQGIQLSTSVAASTMYMGFNWLDATVGGGGCDPLLINPLAIRLGEQITLAKSLVMAKPADCGSCRQSVQPLQKDEKLSCRDRSERARKLRHAIAIAVDYEEFISIFANGRGIAAQSPIPPGIFGYREGETGINHYEYDWKDGAPKRKSIEEARKLLAEAGYPNGIDAQSKQPLVIYLDTTPTGLGSKANLDWLRKQFDKLNVQLVVRSTDYNRFQDKIRKGDTQLFYWGWHADYPDPENFLFLLHSAQGKVSKGGENAANYSNPEFDRLFDRMKNMPNGPARQAIINDMLEILRHDSPWLWGFHPKDYVLHHGWEYNSKPNKMANNSLKYLRIDAAQREQMRKQWNQPVRWPLWLGVIALLLFGVWMWRVLKKREEAR